MSYDYEVQLQVEMDNFKTYIQEMQLASYTCLSLSLNI